MPKSAKIDARGVIVVPAPKSVPNKDHLHRLNYLYQLSRFQAVVNRTDPNDALARAYGANLTAIQQRTKTALAPSIKRTLCKKCRRPLLPGATCRPRVTNVSKDKRPSCDLLVLQCTCSTVKRFPIGRDRSYRPFSECDENIRLLAGPARK
ncbi:LAMI_0A06766g1_1 [Lachancea mirantina]|uniref:LAMI_0A06766g1_1 n=1 Tax=Lachancea mirantina TaxID=1230905 RepID=A0A1G4IR23_9SACH|nr:LAMI_0A06766g1_1 [Lachancea mirantina]